MEYRKNPCMAEHRLTGGTKKKIRNRTTDERGNIMERNTIVKIGMMIETAERMRNAYFWMPPTNAGSRRAYERQNSVPTVKWNENGHVYTAEFRVICSCAHVYTNGVYTKDGKKTNLVAIRNSYKRLAAGA